MPYLPLTTSRCLHGQHDIVNDMHDPVAGLDVLRHNNGHIGVGIASSNLEPFRIHAFGLTHFAIGHFRHATAVQPATIDNLVSNGVKQQDIGQGVRVGQERIQRSSRQGRKGIIGGGKDGKCASGKSFTKIRGGDSGTKRSKAIRSAGNLGNRFALLGVRTILGKEKTVVQR
jgi:hypothetical protein